MKMLMIRYRYTFALFYNTAHLLHDIEKLQGVQQLIFLVFIADGDNLQQIPPLFFIVHDNSVLVDQYRKNQRSETMLKSDR